MSRFIVFWLLCRFSGNWLSSMTVAPLDTPRSRIFMRTLHGPEVQSKVFTFALLSNDVKAKIFTRILKHKFNDIVSVFVVHARNDVGACVRPNKECDEGEGNKNEPISYTPM